MEKLLEGDPELARYITELEQVRFAVKFQLVAFSDFINLASEIVIQDRTNQEANRQAHRRMLGPLRNQPQCFQAR